jgi:hypothetical protein
MKHSTVSYAVRPATGTHSDLNFISKFTWSPDRHNFSNTYSYRVLNNKLFKVVTFLNHNVELSA